MDSSDLKHLNPQLKTQVVRWPANIHLLKSEGPFRLLVVGPSGCGKSTFIVNFIKKQVETFQRSFREVYFSYPPGTISLQSSVVSKLKELFPALILHEGLITSEVLCNRLKPTVPYDDQNNKLVIIDDLWSQIGQSEDFLLLTQILSRRTGLFLVVSSQNLYDKGKHSVSIRRNFTNFVLFHNFVDKSPLLTLSRQIFPGHSTNILLNCMKTIVEMNDKHYEQYIYVCAEPATKMPACVRLATAIFEKVHE